MSMKILHVIHGIDPQAGGPQYVIGNEIRELCRAGHEVALLATDTQYGRATLPRDDYVRSIHANPDFGGAEVYLGHAHGSRPPWSNFAFSPECARWLRRRLSDPRKRPDVVHINATYSHVATSAAAGARRRAIPYVIRPFGNLDYRSVLQGHHYVKRVFSRLFLQKDLQRAARVLACSLPEAEELRNWVPEERLAVIPHGVEVPSFDRHEAARAFLEKYPRCRGRRLLLFLGRVDQVKRPEMIVAAMERLRGLAPNLILLVAGEDGGHAEALRNIVAKQGMEDSVIFAGFLKGDLKRGAFAAAEVLVLPSAHENFGIVVVEAMAHGVPVLVTPEVACHVHVDQSGAGLTVHGDPDALAKGLAQLLTTDQRAEMGRKGRDYIEKHLAWPQIGRQLEILYQEVAAERICIP
jgi:glycosyltransferase involved in cell wall biosynthesis